MSCLNCEWAWSKCLTLFKIHCSVLRCCLRWSLRLQKVSQQVRFIYIYIYILYFLLFCFRNCKIVIPLLSFTPLCHLPTASKYLTSYNGIASRVILVATVDIGAPSNINLFWPLMWIKCQWTFKSLDTDKEEHAPFSYIVRTKPQWFHC